MPRLMLVGARYGGPRLLCKRKGGLLKLMLTCTYAAARRNLALMQMHLGCRLGV